MIIRKTQNKEDDDMTDDLNRMDDGIAELNDDELTAVSGGYGVGDTVRCSKYAIEYCSNCGVLLKNYRATITGVRGVLDGKTLYWVTYGCCGKKTSIIETEILG